MSEVKLDKATLANGCFWCTEAVFQMVKGVKSVASGFSGGHIKNPAYREVVSGRTGHAECLQIEFDPAIVSYEELLEVFWKTHDPTTLNRQGNDVGTQYRSAIFFHSDAQQESAEAYKKQLNGSGTWSDPIVTEIVPFEAFYPAEDYHKNYYNQNKSQPYCAFVVRPKVEKFKKNFPELMKESAKV